MHYNAAIIKILVQNTKREQKAQDSAKLIMERNNYFRSLLYN